MSCLPALIVPGITRLLQPLLKYAFIYAVMSCAGLHAENVVFTMKNGEVFEVASVQKTGKLTIIDWRRARVPHESGHLEQKTPVYLVVTRGGNRLVANIARTTSGVRILKNDYFENDKMIRNELIEEITRLTVLKTKSGLTVQGILESQDDGVYVMRSIGLPFSKLVIQEKYIEKEPGGFKENEEKKHKKPMESWSRVLELQGSFLFNINRVQQFIPYGYGMAMAYRQRRIPVFYKQVPWFSFEAQLMFFNHQKGIRRIMGLGPGVGLNYQFYNYKVFTFDLSSIHGAAYLWLRRNPLELETLTYFTSNAVAMAYQFRQYVFRLAVQVVYVADQEQALFSLGPRLAMARRF